MAVSFLAVQTPAAAGVTTSAGTTAITPTLPTGTASGDRVYVVQAANNTSATAPTSWTVVAQDVQVGPTGTAPGAGTGRRYLSVYYRDYDGVWTMPAFSLTSATQNTHAVTAITLRKGASDTWNTPTWSGVGNTSSAVTSYSVATPSFTTAVGMLIVGTATNDNVTASGESLTQTGATFANLTERADTGSATGNDVSIKAYTAGVTTGATAAITHAATLSGTSEGGSGVVLQTVTEPPGPKFAAVGAATATGAAANIAIAYPTPVAANDVLLAHIYDETLNLSITPPGGWAEITPAPQSNLSENRVFWARAAGGETGSVTFTHASATRGGVMTRWTGCVTTGNPFEAPGGSSAAGTSVNATTTPAVSDTTDGADRLVVFAATNWTASGSWTPPTGFTEHLDTTAEIGTIASEYQAAAGGTGSTTATASASGPLTARLILLVPPDTAAMSPPPDPRIRRLLPLLVR